MSSWVKRYGNHPLAGFLSSGPRRLVTATSTEMLLMRGINNNDNNEEEEEEEEN